MSDERMTHDALDTIRARWGRADIVCMDDLPKAPAVIRALLAEVDMLQRERDGWRVNASFNDRRAKKHAKRVLELGDKRIALLAEVDALRAERDALRRENALFREELEASKHGGTIALMEETAALGIENKKLRTLAHDLLKRLDLASAYGVEYKSTVAQQVARAKLLGVDVSWYE